MGWIGSSADIAGGAAMVPIANSDTIIVRNIIVGLPKNTAVVAQPKRLQIIRYRTSRCFIQGLLTLISRPALLHEKAWGKARSARHSVNLWSSFAIPESTFFRAQPEGMGRILPSPSLLAAYRGLLCGAARASYRKNPSPSRA
jgi:hypothetical protein